MKSLARYLFATMIAAVFASMSCAAQDLDTPSIYASRSSVQAHTPQTFPAFEIKNDSVDGDPSVAESKGSQFAIPAVTVTSSLAVVLGLFAAMVWLTRKYGSRSIAPGAIPREVMESLGTTAIDPRTRVTMLRCGGRIIVIAQTATEVRPLAEITDSEEVRRLTAACLGDSKRNFATTLHLIEKEKPEAGFTGDTSSQDYESPRPRGRLFASA